jgi:Ran GTPase-activating protein (RanGAP) involved in mRNA processing and transport
LTKNLSEFDKLCESVNFKKMEKEDLQKLYSKKKWLQKSSTFLNQIILKDMEDSDEEGSDKDSEEGSDKDSEEEEEEEEEEGGIPKFQPKLSSLNFKFSKGNRIAEYTQNST